MEFSAYEYWEVEVMIAPPCGEMAAQHLVQ